ncbi:MAG TPA: DPP IV N-terminal domain-containing protein [Aggregatilineaceae bacterium]|nr:DPP IV N-terminal domain-containing protein [Aggregatilineaceae bacterium]
MGTSDPQIDELLRQGIEAARAGNKEAARGFLEQVVERDQYSEKGWFWLAAVTADEDEKRICLGNVILINPQNERAQQLLDQLENRRVSKTSTSTSAAAGVNRKTVYVAIGLGIAAVLALLLVLAMMLGGEDKPTTTTQENKPSNTPREAPTDNQSTSVTTEIAALPQNTPLPATPTPNIINTMPPTWTPRPSATPKPSLGTALPVLPAAANASGWIIMQSGQALDGQNYPIAIIKPDGSQRMVLSPDVENGRMPILSPDSTQYAYVFTNSSFEVLMQLGDVESKVVKGINKRWANNPALLDYSEPCWSPDGSWIAFTALDLATRTRDLYMVSMVGADDNPENLKRLTQNDVVENRPTFSPDSQQLIFSATTDPQDSEPFTDLYLYDISSGKTTALTSNGADLTETSPDWAPNGNAVVFEGLESGSTNVDLYLIQLADGNTGKITDLSTDAGEARPRYSPDGRFLMFSSNRTGDWNVFIYDLGEQALYQVTSDPWVDLGNDWSG